MLKSHVLRVVYTEPLIRGSLAGEDLKMLIVANVLARIDVNPRPRK
jgi:hypothetical protein